MRIHEDTVSAPMKMVLDELMRVDVLKPFRLVGGTSLALQLGHRVSIDIDLFAGGGSQAPHSLALELAKQFPKRIKIARVQQHGLSALIDNIKVDIYDWKVPFFDPEVEVRNLRLASIRDIFAYKCEAILGRRVEKDYVDLAEIARQEPLSELMNVFQARYPYMTKGAILAVLLKPDAFARDTTILYLQANSWEKYVDTLTHAIRAYEHGIQAQKQKEIVARAQKIQSLIEQKRKKT